MSDQNSQVVHKFVSNFAKGFGDGQQAKEALSIYHTEVKWFDHAFHICRVGHDAIVGLNKTFLHCNQPFSATVEAIHPTPTGAVVEQTWKGCCKNDIVRPDGEIAVHGTGKDFVAQVCMILTIQDGLITQIDEYYNKRWDLGVGRDDYKVVKGSFGKTTS